jgi:hypothetical protein
MHMRKVLFIVFLLTVFSRLYSDEKQDKSNEYIANCNISLGLSFGIGGDISGTNSLNIRLVDRYNDVYTFNYDPDSNDKSILGFNIMLSFPFYYNNFLSVGMYGQALLGGLGAANDSALYYGGGLYGEGKYKHYSLRIGLGLFGINMSKYLGTLNSAWAGDPGYYTGSQFIKPGESLTASSYEFLGLSYNIAFKYYPFKKEGFLGGIFLQLGYYFFPSITISEYEIKLKGITIDQNNDLPTFKIEPIHNISIMFGIGL